VLSNRKNLLEEGDRGTRRVNQGTLSRCVQLNLWRKRQKQHCERLYEKNAVKKVRAAGENGAAGLHNDVLPLQNGLFLLLHRFLPLHGHFCRYSESFSCCGKMFTLCWLIFPKCSKISA
jgi:hypothetical protein